MAFHIFLAALFQALRVAAVVELGLLKELRDFTRLGRWIAWRHFRGVRTPSRQARLRYEVGQPGLAFLTRRVHAPKPIR